MGICASCSDFNNTKKPQTCWICEQPLMGHPRYLKCVKCKSIFHINCLYRTSDSMNDCLKCGSDSLILINNSPNAISKTRRWSSSKNQSQKDFSNVGIK